MGEWIRVMVGFFCSCINVYGYGVLLYLDWYFYNRSYFIMILVRRMVIFFDIVVIVVVLFFMSRWFCFYIGVLRVERVRICVLLLFKFYIFFF